MPAAISCRAPSGAGTGPQSRPAAADQMSKRRRRHSHQDAPTSTDARNRCLRTAGWLTDCPLARCLWLSSLGDARVSSPSEVRRWCHRRQVLERRPFYVKSTSSHWKRVMTVTGHDAPTPRNDINANFSSPLSATGVKEPPCVSSSLSGTDDGGNARCRVSRQTDNTIACSLRAADGRSLAYQHARLGEWMARSLLAMAYCVAQGRARRSAYRLIVSPHRPTAVPALRRRRKCSTKNKWQYLLTWF